MNHDEFILSGSCQVNLPEVSAKSGFDADARGRFAAHDGVNGAGHRTFAWTSSSHFRTYPFVYFVAWTLSLFQVRS